MSCGVLIIFMIIQLNRCGIAFCPDAGEKVKVTVRSDSVYSVMKLSDSDVIPYPTSKLYLSVDSLFGVISKF